MDRNIRLSPARASSFGRWGYVAVIILATLTDLHPDFIFGDIPPRIVRAFASLANASLRDAVDGVRNVALFAGFGVVWVVTSRKGHIWASAGRATLIGCVLSVFVETMQLFSPVRTSSILDVITNTTGTLAGALIVCWFIVLVHRARGKRSFVGIPAFLFAGSYAIATMMEAFAPLLRDERLPNLGGGIAQRVELAWKMMDFSSMTDIAWTDIPIFFPAGVFAVAWLAEHDWSYDRAWRSTALWSIPIFTAIEIIHGVASEPIVWGSVLTHVLSIAAGAWVAARFLPSASSAIRGKQRPRLLLMIYIAIVAWWSWRPFYPDFSAESIGEQFSAVHWVPLQALAVRVDLFSVTDIVTQFLLYLPIGALLAVWPLRTRGAWRGLFPALYFSAVLELGKIVIADRFFDVTHILIQCAGAAVGWIVVHRSGFNVYGEVWGDDPARRPSPKARARSR